MSDAPWRLASGRFERFERIAWWDQRRLREARVLVVGAGALGNEVLKNLSLLGVGHVAVADMDCVEESNLARSVLFRPSDAGRPKAAAAAAAAQEIYADMHVMPLVGNILGDVGLGWFRWAEVVVGALDNREARVFVNSTCARLGRPWIDGGIEVLNGIVRGFAPPGSACYECTMGEADWRQLNQRRSCSLLARRATEAGGTPTTPTTASVIGALQAQEVVKFLHGLDWLAGAGFVLEGLMHTSYRVAYDVRADCPWHEPPPPVEECPEFDSQSTWRSIANAARRRLGGLDAIDLAREIVTVLSCPSCGDRHEVFRPLHHVSETEAVCGRCGQECLPEFAHSIAADSPWLDMTVEQFGVPAWDVVWARWGETMLGMTLSGDALAHHCRDEESVA